MTQSMRTKDIRPLALQRKMITDEVYTPSFARPYAFSSIELALIRMRKTLKAMAPRKNTAPA